MGIPVGNKFMELVFYGKGFSHGEQPVGLVDPYPGTGREIFREEIAVI
jgi:hypothetical protein